MSSATPARGRIPEWLACGREARSIVDGEVHCPRGDVVAWERCLECRLLEAVDDDRELGCGELEQSGPAMIRRQNAIDAAPSPR